MLHKIVLGIVCKDLEQELQASTADINSQDTIGRTPLSMAAERGETGYLTTLLDYGGNTGLPSYSYQTPLHYAASAKDPECIQLLLAAGEDVDCMTNWDQTPLHLAAAYTKNAAHATLLLDAGANLNLPDKDGITPLGWTALSNNIEVASVLLDRGANIYDIDHHGSSTLRRCIYSNRHEILEMLLSKRPQIYRCISEEESVWDVIAETADLETLRLLRQLDFTEPSMGSRPISHYSGADKIMNRVDGSPELTEAFQALVQLAADQQNAIPEYEDEETWEDAMEHLT